MYGVQSVEVIYIDEPLFKEPNLKSREKRMDYVRKKDKSFFLFSLVLQPKRNPEFQKHSNVHRRTKQDGASHQIIHLSFLFFFSSYKFNENDGRLEKEEFPIGFAP